MLLHFNDRLLLHFNDRLPRYVLITEARRSEVKIADAFPPNPGSIVSVGASARLPNRLEV